MPKPYLNYTYDGYGFGTYWTLVIPATKTIEQQSFFLGQDVKVCYRLLGMMPQQLCNLLGVKQLLLHKTSVNLAIARLIVRSCGGLRELRKLEPWALHVGGG